VQVEPIARLRLEGGYDSNVLYDGRGGDNVGVVSPDLGVTLVDHTWNLAASAGGDLLMYAQRHSAPVWNQRGMVVLHARPEASVVVDGDLAATYAPDPIGLARLGIFGRTGAALIGHASARAAWRFAREWRAAATFSEHVVRFDAGDGAASHTPGVELMRLLGPRLELGGAYRFDVFQGFGPGATDARAHEAQALLRYRLSRRARLEAEAGPAVWTSPSGGAISVVPQAMVQLFLAGRGRDARFTLRHGVGLGNLATPALFDAAEVAVRTRLGRSVELHADGGVWRSGAIPWGANSVVGYGMEGGVDWVARTGLRIGIAASRFARADAAVTTYNRNVIGLRVAWELRHR
jgi:hypothetical protein